MEKAALEDVPALTRLLNDAYLPVESFLYDGPRTDEAEVADRLAQGTFLVRRAADRLDGCVYLKATGGGRGYLGMLAVSPRLKGTGLGRTMALAGEAFLREQGVAVLEIEVISIREELFGFYDRLGYRVTGERPFEHPSLHVPCHLVVMEKSIRAQDPSSPAPA